MTDRYNGVEMGYKEKIAAWIMRFVVIRPVAQIPLLGATAYSTSVTALATVGYSHLIVPLTAFSFVVGILLVYLYVETDVANIQAMLEQDRTSNFVGPDLAASQEIRGKQLEEGFKHLAEVLENKADSGDIEGEISGVTKEKIKEYRRGIDMEDYKE